MKTTSKHELADGVAVSPFAFKALRRMGLEPWSMTVRDVAALSRARIVAAPGNGRSAWLALHYLVDAHGLALAESPQPPSTAPASWRERLRRATAEAAREVCESLALAEAEPLGMMGHRSVPALLGAMVSEAARRALVVEALEASGWSLPEAAADLGMHPIAARWLVEELGLAARVDEAARRRGAARPVGE